MNISNLTLEQKVGQLFLVALNGTTLSDEYKQHYKHYNLGNYIYFAQNLTDYKSIRQLSDSLQEVAKEISGIPAFISVDQEGGMVTRAYSGATHFPSNMAITASGMGDMAGKIGKMVGYELKGLGINLNHAPVLDVNNNGNNPVIGIRSYADNPAVVAQMGVEYINGLQSNGVMANAKHFPGHGDTNVDSHLALPSIDHDFDRLNTVELVPFKAALSDVDSIMTAHIIFKAIDPTVPATLSSKVITEFLRGKLGYEGLVLTDCMSMNAIKDFYTSEKGCVMAINAGADIICLNGTMDVQAKCYTAVLEAARAGEISMEKIDTAVQRIIKYKEKYNLAAVNNPPQESYPPHNALADEMSAKSITLIKGSGTITLDNASENIFAISPPPSKANIADDTIVTQHTFCKKAAEEFGCNYAEITIDPTDTEISDIIAKTENHQVILYATYNAILNPGQVNLFNALKNAGKQIATVSLRVPYDALALKGADCYIAAYEYTNRAVTNTLLTLAGKIPFTGKLPLQHFEVI